MSTVPLLTTEFIDYNSKDGLRQQHDTRLIIRKIFQVAFGGVNVPVSDHVFIPARPLPSPVRRTARVF